VPCPAEAFPVAFDSLTKDNFAADRTTVFALDFQQRFQFGEHGWPPVACDKIATVSVGRAEANFKRRTAYSGMSKMADVPENTTTCLPAGRRTFTMHPDRARQPVT